MSDRTTLLACFKYFLGYQWSCLTRAKKAKVAEGDLTTGSIGVIFTEDVSVWDVSGGLVSAGYASAEGIYIDVRPSTIGFWLSIK